MIRAALTGRRRFRTVPDERHQRPRFLGIVLGTKRRHPGPSHAVLNHREQRTVAHRLNVGRGEIRHRRGHLPSQSREAPPPPPLADGTKFCQKIWPPPPPTSLAR